MTINLLRFLSFILNTFFDVVRQNLLLLSNPNGRATLENVSNNIINRKTAGWTQVL